MPERKHRDMYQENPAQESADNRLRPDLYEKKPNELAGYERLLRELERRPIEQRKDMTEG